MDNYQDIGLKDVSMLAIPSLWVDRRTLIRNVDLCSSWANRLLTIYLYMAVKVYTRISMLLIFEYFELGNSQTLPICRPLGLDTSAPYRDFTYTADQATARRLTSYRIEIVSCL